MDMREAFSIFLQEASEHLQHMENALLARSACSAAGEDWINEVFRALHTLKGSGSMFGLSNITILSHQAESVFDEVRNGRIADDENLISLGLSVKDELGNQLSKCSPPNGPGFAHGTDGPIDPDKFNALIMALDSLLPAHKRALSGSQVKTAAQLEKPEADDQPESPPPGMAALDLGGKPVSVWSIRFVPEKNLVRNGTNPLMIMQDLIELGMLECKADTGGIPALEDLDPSDFHMAWDFTLVSDASENRIRDVFIFVDNGSNVTIELIRRGPIRAVDELLAVKQHQELEEQKEAAQNLTEPHALPEAASRKVPHPDAKPPAPANPAPALQGDASRGGSYIRVHALKLQELLDTVGELTVFQEKLRSLAKKNASADSVSSMFGELEGLSRRLGNLAVEMNMVGIGSIFSGYQRLIRDLSQNLGKKIRLELSGTETELDKSIAEGLKDPLLHLIRNALDHGLETPEERSAAGKNETGTLRISANHAGGSVMIHISDDGRGLNLEAIQAKAIERGLITPEQKLSRDELINLIFLPGFSTAAKVSDVSGRGVGMDVVRSCIENLRGTIRLNTTTGKGTDITLTIPLTLALVDVLITRTQDLHKAFILEDIAEIVDAATCPVIQHDPVKGRTIVSWRDQALSCIDLGSFYNGSLGQHPGRTASQAKAAPKSDTQDKGCYVVISQDGRSLGLKVDEVIESSQGMIKPLDQMLRKAPGISGSLLFGEGHVAWVINTAWFLSRQFQKES